MCNLPGVCLSWFKDLSWEELTLIFWISKTSSDHLILFVVIYCVLTCSYSSILIYNKNKFRNNMFLNMWVLRLMFLQSLNYIIEFATRNNLIIYIAETFRMQYHYLIRYWLQSLDNVLLRGIKRVIPLFRCFATCINLGSTTLVELHKSVKFNHFKMKWLASSFSSTKANSKSSIFSSLLLSFSADMMWDIKVLWIEWYESKRDSSSEYLSCKSL